MNDSEREEAYDALRAMALEHEIGWAVEQAEDQIRDGRTVALTDPVVVKLPGRKRSSTIEKGTRTEPYSPLERLEIMATALRRAVVLPALLQEDVLKFFAESASERDETPPAVQLLATTDPRRQLVQLGEPDVRAARRLEVALNALMEEARQ